MSTQNDVKDVLIDQKTVKSDEIPEEENGIFVEYSQVKCTEPCAPVSKETNTSPLEFKGTLVVTCCPCPETKKCDDCEVKCSCDKKKCDCVDCQCDNCQCEKKTTNTSYLEKMFPCFYPVNVTPSEPTK